jgi:hypothetical protein
MSYLASVGSSKNNTIDTNVSDDGKEGEANCDQFVTSKFYLRNESRKSGSLDLSGNVEYKINIEITKNYRNAANALRIAVLEISDEEKIYDPDTGIYDNNYFNIEVFGKPTEYVNGNETSYSNVPEYVATTMSGIYTDGCNSLRLQVFGGEGQPSIPLIKNPNKGHENEDWQCVNFTNNLQTFRWEYDSLRDANKTYSLDYKQERAYVVAAWFEASDPDHCDDISSGYVAFTVSFTVVENESSN